MELACFLVVSFFGTILRGRPRGWLVRHCRCVCVCVCMWVWGHPVDVDVVVDMIVWCGCECDGMCMELFSCISTQMCMHVCACVHVCVCSCRWMECTCLQASTAKYKCRPLSSPPFIMCHNLQANTMNVPWTTEIVQQRSVSFFTASYLRSSRGAIVWVGQNNAREKRCTSEENELEACWPEPYIYTVYLRHFWHGNHQICGHIRCIYTVLANPTSFTYSNECTVNKRWTVVPLAKINFHVVSWPGCSLLEGMMAKAVHVLRIAPLLTASLMIHKWNVEMCLFICIVSPCQRAQKTYHHICVHQNGLTCVKRVMQIEVGWFQTLEALPRLLCSLKIFMCNTFLVLAGPVHDYVT